MCISEVERRGRGFGNWPRGADVGPVAAGPIRLLDPTVGEPATGGGGGYGGAYCPGWP